MKWFSQFVLRLTGWKVVYTVPHINKSVICLAPHTSNWDFLFAKLIYASIDNHQPHFFMKKEWFFFPFGVVLRWMGGVPVDRNRKASLTDLTAEQFHTHTQYHIGVAPEGTRKAVSEWKKGFYYIALKANVPIQLAYLDYAKKEGGITKLFYPTGDEEKDLKEIHDFYKNVTPRFPERFGG